MNTQDLEFFIEAGYPCVIVGDRYSGTYSGAQWTAFPEDEVPEDCMADDVSCRDFWRTRKTPVGKGDDPGAAWADLISEVKKELEKRKA